MLGVGWLEMLFIGIVALVVIGPKELPALMNKLGKFAGTIRRMGQDFQRELNKTTGLDEIKNLRTSITAPLKATTDAIRKEFNTVTPSGTVQPSGALKPADPKVESVVNEIHAAAGIKPPQTPAEAMKDAVTKRVAETAAVAPAAAAAAAPVKATRTVKAAKAPAKAAPAAVPAKPKATPKAAAKKAVESPAPVEAIAPAKKPAAKKPAAKKPAAKKVAAKAAPTPAAIVAPAKAPAKRKPAAKKAV
jgi:sec-independent protein translocase protein TatB